MSTLSDVMTTLETKTIVADIHEGVLDAFDPSWYEDVDAELMSIPTPFHDQTLADALGNLQAFVSSLCAVRIMYLAALADAYHVSVDATARMSVRERLSMYYVIAGGRAVSWRMNEDDENSVTRMTSATFAERFGFDQNDLLDLERLAELKVSLPSPHDRQLVENRAQMLITRMATPPNRKIV